MTAMTERRRPGGQRDPELEARWRAHVAAWQSSGLTARAFCRERGLGENSFYAWRRELRVRDGLPPQTRPTRSTRSRSDAAPAVAVTGAGRRSRPAFVAVNVAAARTPEAGSIAPVVIVLKGGTCVRVHEQAEVSTITNALRALWALREAVTTNGAASC